MIKNLKSKILSLVLILALFVTGCSSSTDGISSSTSISQSSSNMTVTFLDTGNSDAILIKDSGKYLLIDSADNDDEKYMVKYLQQNNIDKLDYFILTHYDADHIGGSDEILDNVEVDTLLVPNGDAETKTYRDFITSASNAGVAPSVPLEGAKFDLGRSYFEVYNTDGGDSKNDDSLVVKLTNGKDKFLFTGDAGTEIEEKIVNKIGDVDVLKVGHHGSYSSTSDEFVRKINPEYAVILCGADNKYGHPHKEPMDVLKNNDVEVHRSDECGEIVFESTGNGVKTDCEVGTYNPGVNSKYSNSSSTNKTNTISNKTQWTSSSSSSDSSSNDIVYWTPNGEVYHLTKDCHSLSNSKTINKGRIKESGRTRAHKNCK